MNLPHIVPIRQRLDTTREPDPARAAAVALCRLLLKKPLKPGATVAVTAGSRGITDMTAVLKAVVATLMEAGAKPCIIPAMGSHGGATAEGQKEVLDHLGVTEEAMGAPVRSSMETVVLGYTPDGLPVHMDRLAAGCDHILAVNRVKPHTEFHGRIESGLTKMLVIGLGKYAGAEAAHSYAVRYGYERVLASAGRLMLDKAPILGGIGIVENGVGQTARVELIEPETWFEAEEKLLEVARRMCPKLPFDPLDVLLVDESGKSVSGTGMDTKVIGRIMNIYEKPLTKPKITRIVLRDLTRSTDGNTLGVGLADFVTRKVADKANPAYTMVNCVTAVTPEKGRMPLVCDSDLQAVEFALATAGPLTSEEVRLAWIRNTSTLDTLWVSTALAVEAGAREDIEILGPAVAMSFDAAGELIAPTRG